MPEDHPLSIFAAPAPRVEWTGIHEIDSTNWWQSPAWASFYRGDIGLAWRPRTYAELVEDARAAGVIVCDCVWVHGVLTVWVPWCQAHGGHCTALGCDHRHVRIP